MIKFEIVFIRIVIAQSTKHLFETSNSTKRQIFDFFRFFFIQSIMQILKKTEYKYIDYIVILL